jgi:hypothetical protein
VLKLKGKNSQNLNATQNTLFNPRKKLKEKNSKKLNAQQNTLFNSRKKLIK